MRLNKTLQRQLQRARLHPENTSKDLLPLIEILNDYYDEVEAERVFIEQTIEISSNELLEMNEKLKLQSDELVAKNQELQEITRALSHELKEPLRAINSYLQIIANRIEAEDTDTKSFVEVAVRNTKQMHLLLQGLQKYMDLTDSKDKRMNMFCLADAINISIRLLKNSGLQLRY